MTVQQSYEELVVSYAAQLRTLFQMPSMDLGPGGSAQDMVAARAEQLVETAEQVGTLTADYLEASDASQRVVAEMRLLAHTAASAEAARGLLAMAAPAAPAMAVASLDAQPVALDEFAALLEAPMAGIPLAAAAMQLPGPTQEADAQMVKSTLADEAARTIEVVTTRASGLVDQGLRDLLLLDGATLYRGVELVSKDAARLLDQAVSALGSFAYRLATAAVRLLVQAFDSILALLGGNTEAARRQMAGWVDQLKARGAQPQGLTPITQLVTRLYAPEAVREDIQNWLQATQAAPTEIAQVTTTVQGLAEHYNATAKRVEQVLKVLSFAKAVPVASTPQGTVVMAAAILGILGYAVFAGYTHVDTGRIAFGKRFGFDIPERIAGVRQTVQQALSVAEEPPPPQVA